MEYPRHIQKLIEHFSQLPTVGPKTAERYVFYLLKQPSEKLQNFSDDLKNLRKGLKICKNCFTISESDPCPICSDSSRDKNLICVVSNTQDLISIENIGRFKGVYHVLGGYIDTVENMGPEKLTIKHLIKKVEENPPKEIVLALNPTFEGETTSKYIAQVLKKYNIKITRLARGLPTGSGLEYADAMTILNAFENRNEIK
ncbi:recombination mediator RecR [bacterium]|nr:recombination mediator RecR [bacterium]